MRFSDFFQRAPIVIVERHPLSGRRVHLSEGLNVSRKVQTRLRRLRQTEIARRFCLISVFVDSSSGDGVFARRKIMRNVDHEPRVSTRRPLRRTPAHPGSRSCPAGDAARDGEPRTHPAKPPPMISQSAVISPSSAVTEIRVR